MSAKGRLARGGSADGSLAGRGIVITRPADQAAPLASLVRERGGRAILFPVIEIRDIEDATHVEAIIGRLDDFDLAIFISPNAVARGWRAIHARRSLPSKLALAAIGGASARELQRLGGGEVIAPREGGDSESLLGLPELESVAGKRIVIFRGAGGRELLRETLENRGASVEYAECYRRVRPDADVAALLRMWDGGDIDALVITSSEGLRNFREMLGEDAHERIARTPLFVPHPRIAATARDLGLTDIIVTGAGDLRIAAAVEARLAPR